MARQHNCAPPAAARSLPEPRPFAACTASTAGRGPSFVSHGCATKWRMISNCSCSADRLPRWPPDAMPNRVICVRLAIAQLPSETHSSNGERAVVFLGFHGPPLGQGGYVIGWHTDLGEDTQLPLTRRAAWIPNRSRSGDEAVAEA